VIWTYKTADGDVAVAGGIIYVSQGTQGFLALNDTTGKVIWEYATTYRSLDPAIANGVVYVGSYGGKIYAFSSSSQTHSVSFSEIGLPLNAKWSVTFNNQTQSSSSNTIIFSVFNGIYAFSITPPAGYTVSPSSGNITVNGTDVVQHVTFRGPPVHEVTVTSVISLKTIVGRGYGTQMNVTAKNTGDYSESFDVTLYANATVIGTRIIYGLPSENWTTMMFIWNTTGFAYGNYTISANVTLASGETNTWTGPFTYGTVVVAIPGDVGCYHQVNILDVVMITSRYGLKQGDPNFNPNCDIDGDGKITILDVIACTSHYGQKWH
jgi:hypothetical protein